MTILCRIKKALDIHSPAPYEYCNLHLNASNKKRCFKCKHFKISQYTAYEVGRKVVKAMSAAVESVNKLGDALKGGAE